MRVKVLVEGLIPVVLQFLDVGIVKIHLQPGWVSMAPCQAAQPLYSFNP